MARPREFDPEKTLQVAIDVFWENGYSDTSVDEIVRRSGVAKYGIYGTFGNKDELFMKVLTQYTDDRKNDVRRALGGEDVSLPELIEFFAHIIVKITDEPESKGCLLCKTSIELGASNPGVVKLVHSFFAYLANVILDVLKRAAAKGQLDESKATIETATFLANEFRAARMLSRSGVSRRDIQNHFEVALSVLH